MESPIILKASSITISSPSSLARLSVAFKIICSPPVSSSVRSISPDSKVGSDGFPSRRILNPACSLNTLSPASALRLLVPSKLI